MSPLHGANVEKPILDECVSWYQSAPAAAAFWVSCRVFNNLFGQPDLTIIMLMELWVTLPPKSTVGLPEAQKFQGTVVFLSILLSFLLFLCDSRWQFLVFLSPSNDADRNRYFTSFSTSPIKIKQQH